MSNNSISYSSLNTTEHNNDVPYNTLDEPISATILRDLKVIGSKLQQVLIPTNNINDNNNNTDSNDNTQSNSSNTTLAYTWDLYGPLMLCLILAVSLSYSSSNDQSGSIFAAVFMLVWLGGMVITLNTLLLQGSISFLQSICVLGYCIAPLVLSSILCHIIYNYFMVQCIVVFICLLWSIKASLSFITHLIAEDKKLLAVYPVVLFYVTISWMILVQ